jgi:hypothetical protein
VEGYRMDGVDKCEGLSLKGEFSWFLATAREVMDNFLSNEGGLDKNAQVSPQRRWSWLSRVMQKPYVRITS